jgi:hypothetical protein
MSRDPYSWADQVGRDGQAAITNAQSREQNALMNVFQEEASRQRPFVTMPAELAQAQFNRQNAEPFQIAQEQRQMQNDMAMRRYYAEHPIPRLSTDPADATGATAGPVDNGDGTMTIMINGNPVKVPVQ